MPEQVEYEPGTGHQFLTNSGHLQVCEDECEPEHITVKLQLETKHIGKGCDRDTYSISSQRKLCGKFVGGVIDSCLQYNNLQDQRHIPYNGISLSACRFVHNIYLIYKSF